MATLPRHTLTFLARRVPAQRRPANEMMDVVLAAAPVLMQVCGRALVLVRLDEGCR